MSSIFFFYILLILPITGIIFNEKMEMEAIGGNCYVPIQIKKPIFCAADGLVTELCPCGQQKCPPQPPPKCPPPIQCPPMHVQECPPPVEVPPPAQCLPAEPAECPECPSPVQCGPAPAVECRLPEQIPAPSSQECPVCPACPPPVQPCPLCDGPCPKPRECPRVQCPACPTPARVLECRPRPCPPQQPQQPMQCPPSLPCSANSVSKILFVITAVLLILATCALGYVLPKYINLRRNWSRMNAENMGYRTSIRDPFIHAEELLSTPAIPLRPRPIRPVAGPPPRPQPPPVPSTAPVSVEPQPSSSGAILTHPADISSLWRQSLYRTTIYEDAQEEWDELDLDTVGESETNAEGEAERNAG